MQWLLQADTVRKTVRAGVAVQLATLAVCYALWVSEGCDHFMPFISDTDTHPVSGAPFTFGFTVSGLLLTLLAWQMFRLRSDWISANPTGARLRSLNTFSTIFGIFSGLFIVWIAYTPWDEQLALHLLQARVIFGGSIIWAILTTIMTSEMATFDARFHEVYISRRNRTAFTCLCLGLMALSVVQYTGISVGLPVFETYVDMVQICTDLSITEMSVAALFEWAMVLGLIGVAETATREVSLLTSHESEE
ncbi:MAG TPA: hypothetical protein EYQ15_04735 [Candidatus Poseidoniales archaeon]|jgi:hypothetical protein|nr:MAG: hypothetical protein CXT65_06355 [Euryarchaeota archaeon]HIG38590.1 hypothetical protein [Candidatus Poseidoniales archaeon]HIL43903.1 hypothetical protein [Candidatus Poseidoniales archaeon]